MYSKYCKDFKKLNSSRIKSDIFYFVSQGGSLHGKFVDATPFSDAVKGANGKTETESESLVDELGSMLRARGFNYHGVEVLYSGVYGTELTCEIFIGPVYYQRLRHMVSDKYQVRIFYLLKYILQNLYISNVIK